MYILESCSSNKFPYSIKVILAYLQRQQASELLGLQCPLILTHYCLFREEAVSTFILCER